MRRNEQIFWGVVKELRKDYFVEYRPPFEGHKFATLQLTFLGRVEFSYIAEAMELEAAKWHQRYPLPIMISAFDNAGDLVHLEPTRSDHHLIVFGNPEGVLELHWRRVADEELPTDALNRDLMLELFSDVPRKTQTEVSSNAKTHARQIRLAKFIVLMWAGIGPAAWLVIEFLGPGWLAAIIFVYGIWHAVVNILKLAGKWSKSESELIEEAEDLLMRHHHYHCKRNPGGFERLKIENCRNDQRKKVLEDARSLMCGNPLEKS
jgi:hypothetical protein